MKYSCFFLWLLSLCSFAQGSDSLSISIIKEIKYDLDDTKNIKHFDPARIADFKKQNEFDYVEQEKPDNFWTRFKSWIGQLWQKIIRWIFGVDKITGFWAVLFQMLPYLIIIGVLALLVWLFMRINPKNILLEKNPAPQIILTEDEDIIQNQNIEELIAKALQNKNYRLAIRYYYLAVLKKLSQTEFIDWQAQKTNTDYIAELSDHALKSQFQKITRLYDFIWYGSFEIEEATFSRAEKEFKKIANAINT